MRTLVTPLLALALGCQPYAVDIFGEVDQVDDHGILIATNGTGIDAVDVSEVVEGVSVLWRTALRDAGVDCRPSFDGVYLSMQPLPFRGCGIDHAQLCGGLTQDLRNAVWGGGYIVMRVVADEVWRPRLAHELGHVVLTLCGLNRPLDPEGTLLSWATDYGVPY